MNSSFNKMPTVITLSSFSREELEQRIKDKEEHGWMCVSEVAITIGGKRLSNVAEFNKGVNSKRDRRGDRPSKFEVKMKLKS